VIAIVDYGRGNLGSVRKALAELAPEVVVTDDPPTVARADAVVVPGDGAFADAMESLDRLGLIDPIRTHIAAGRPYLGICLGYQLLFTESEEFGHAKGLDVLPGVVRRFPSRLPERERREAPDRPEPPGLPLLPRLPRLPRLPLLKVPHMGWNRVWHDGTLPLLEGIPSGAYFYFVHSYYPQATDAEGVRTAHCEYGIRFPALIARGQLYGTQFHPEKSQRWGLRLLANFARVTREERA
jgi:glutamine amidotransferase